MGRDSRVSSPRTESMPKAEVAIVGGGVVGASIAYHLALRGVEGIVVFEREEALGTGSTGKCAGGVRLQFSTAANVEMVRGSPASSTSKSSAVRPVTVFPCALVTIASICTSVTPPRNTG